MRHWPCELASVSLEVDQVPKIFIMDPHAALKVSCCQRSQFTLYSRHDEPLPKACIIRKASHMWAFFTRNNQPFAEQSGLLHLISEIYDTQEHNTESSSIDLNMSDRLPPGHFRLLYFASAASYTKKTSDDLPAPLPVKDLFEELEKRYKGIKARVLSSSAVTVNLDYVDLETDVTPSTLGPDDKHKGVVIQEGDEVAIIPPVSAG